MKAVRDKVVIKCIEDDDVTKSGIVLPYSILKKWDKHQWGMVMSVGEGYPSKSGKLIKSDLKAGDIVFYTRDNFRPKAIIEGIEVEVATFEDVLFVQEVDDVNQ